MEKIFIKALIERKANGGYSVLASTSTIDRQGDSIDQSGWDLKNFQVNPVMLWAHDYSAPPVAKATNVTVTKAGLVLDYEFAPAEANPFAQQVKALVDGGFLNAVSVGFMPLERNGNSITKMELLEVSFVPVPANPQALQLMLSKGIAADVISKYFEVKEAEIVAAQVEVDKGAVADEVDVQQAYQAKWQNWDSMCEIIGALWEIYFDETTPVEAFGSLLLEACTLLTALAGTPATDSTDTEATTAALKDSFLAKVGKDAAKKYGEAMGAAAVKTLKEAIEKAAKTSETSTALLKELALSSDKSGTGTGVDEPAEVVAEVATTEETVELGNGESELRSLLETRNLLRKEEAAPRAALSAVNALIEKRRAVVAA